MGFGLVAYCNFFIKCQTEPTDRHPRKHARERIVFSPLLLKWVMALKDVQLEWATGSLEIVDLDPFSFAPGACAESKGVRTESEGNMVGAQVRFLYVWSLR